MHGNVLEWCEDSFGPYSKGPDTDPKGPASGVRRVLRGGGWFFGAVDLRSVYRIRGDPGNRARFGGFRLALGPELQPVRPAG